MMMIRYRMVALLAPLVALAPACASAPPVADVQQGDDTSTGDTDPAAPSKTKSTTTKPPPGPPAKAPTACPYDGAPIDVSNFAPCRDGGVCIPDKAFPPEQESQKARLAPCPTGGFCVPAKIVKSANGAVPKTCRSFASMEGRCTSMVFPDIAKRKDQLPQDACDANERCAPCFDPMGKPTGACSAVSCDAPKEPFKPFQACCSSGARSRGLCLPTASMPPEAASGLEKKECSATTDSCVPAEETGDGFVHPKCTASALLGAYDGVCISTCVKMDFLTQIGTARGTCSADSFCAPCTNPLTGEPSGAPDCAP